MTNGPKEAPPRRIAAHAGALYVLSVMVAISGESFLHGTLAYAAGLIAVSCYVAVTANMVELFRKVNRSLAFASATLNLVGLGLEALRWNPGGVNVALGFHGLYCLGFGYLAVRSPLLPRAPGLLMMAGGLAWLMNLWPRLEAAVSPYHVVVGFIGVGSLMLWLLVRGMDGRRWYERAGAEPTG